MSSSRSRSQGVSSLLAATLLLAVLPTIACQPTSRDTATAATLTSQTPTWGDLGARRVCVSCDAFFGVSPDGRFLYGTHWEFTTHYANLLLRVSTAPGHNADRRTGSDLQLRALGNGTFGLPVVSPDGTRVAFTARMPGDDPNDQEVWIVDAETGADLQVIRGAGQTLGWHADGGGLIVASPEGLVSVSLVDDTRRLFLPRSAVELGDWGAGLIVRPSPDGRFVAYAQGGDIHVAALDRSWRGPVVGAEGTQSYPFWAPDGTKLIYRSFQRDRPELWGVEMAEGRAVGPPRVLLTLSQDGPNTEGWVHRPIGIATDGTLFVHRVGNRSDVYTVEIDPETLELRGEPWSVFGGEGPLKTGGALSPDGTLMVFMTRLPHPRLLGRLRGGGILAIRDLATGTDRVLDTPPDLSLAFNEFPVWSPDGRYLLFNLYLFDVVTGEQRWLVEDAPGETVGLFGWLPAGHTVVYGRNSPTETGAMLSVRRHDIATGAERELWQGPVNHFSWEANHLSPDGRYVTLYQEEGIGVPPPDGASWRARPRNRALSILDLETGEIRELYRDTNAVCDPARPSVFPSHQWTRSGREILVANCVNVPEDWGVNERHREHTFFAIPVDGGEWRTLGSVFIEPGGWAARAHDDESGGARFFSLHPNSDALTFTGGGFTDEVWMVPDFGQILEQWREGSP